MFTPLPNITNKTPSGLAFTANPIVFCDETPDSSPGIRAYRFRVVMNDKLIYEGRTSRPVYCDIAEIVDAHTPYFAEPHSSNAYGPFCLIEEESDFQHLRCVYVAFETDYDVEAAFIAVKGGISRQNFRKYSQAGTDVFCERLLSHNSNCFFTTRTADWRLNIKETELYPLYFINDVYGEYVEIADVSTCHVIGTTIPEGVFALDLNRVREMFCERFSILPSVFEIRRNNTIACRIAITQADVSLNRCRLKFRNSLGVFEIIELSGAMKVGYSTDDDDGSEYNVFDPVTDSFLGMRGRRECKNYMQVDTGVKQPEEIAFISDMLCSEEVYLLDYASEPIRVLPSVELMEYKKRQTSPEEFSIRLDCTEADSHIMQLIDDISAGRKPKIFTSIFNDKFN